MPRACSTAPYPKKTKRETKTNMTYSNTLALGRRQSYPMKNRNVVSIRTERRKLGPVSNTIALVILACILGLLYLTLVTRTNAFGYQINSLQSQQSALVQQNNNLQIVSARLQAASRIQGSAVAKSLVAVTPSATVDN